MRFVVWKEESTSAAPIGHAIVVATSMYHPLNLNASDVICYEYIVVFHGSQHAPGASTCFWNVTVGFLFGQCSHWMGSDQLGLYVSYVTHLMHIVVCGIVNFVWQHIARISDTKS